MTAVAHKSLYLFLLFDLCLDETFLRVYLLTYLLIELVYSYSAEWDAKNKQRWV